MTTKAKKEFIVGDDMPETVMVKVSQITEIPETDPEYSEERGEYTFTYPLRISIVDQNKVRVANDRSSATLRPRNWERKFYVNNKGYTAFTRNENLAATFAIYAKVNGDEGGKFNVYDLEGFKFMAVVNYDFDEPFIDWVRTFEANGVEVPRLSRPETQEAQVESDKGAVKVVDPDDLPF